MLETVTEIQKSTTILITDGYLCEKKKKDSKLEIQDYI